MPDSSRYILPLELQITDVDIRRAWFDPSRGWHPNPHREFAGASIKIERHGLHIDTLTVGVFIGNDMIGCDRIGGLPVNLLDPNDPVNEDSREWWRDVIVRPRLECAVFNSTPSTMPTTSTLCSAGSRASAGEPL